MSPRPQGGGFLYPRWQAASFGLLAVFAFLHVLQWPLSPRFLDIYYHLNVMKGFSQAGGYATQAFWEYAPAGRQHLYPPLLHWVMLFFYRCGLQPIDVGRLVDCASYPLLLISFHKLSSKILSPRGAFTALALFSSVASVSLYAPTQAAFNLAVVLGIWAFIFLLNEKTWPAAVLLSLSFYSHTLGGGLCALSVAIYAMLRRQSMRRSLIVAVCAIAMASPFLIYQALHAGRFAFVKVREMELYEIDLLTAVLCLSGLWIVLSKRSWKNAELPIAWLIGFLPAAFTMQTRFFSGHGLIGPALMAAYLIESWWERGGLFKIICAALVVFACLTSPVLEWDSQSGQGTLIWGDRTLTRSLSAGMGGRFRSNSYSVFFPKQYGEIAEVIRENSDSDDILWSDFSYMAGILSLLSDRATSTGMLPEVKPNQQRDAMKDARILVWFKDSEGKAEPAMLASASKRGWRLLKETEMAFVYENPSGYAKRQFPGPHL